MFTRSEPVLNLERCFFQEIYLILQAVSVSVFIFPARFVFSFHVCSVQKTPGRWSRFSPGDQRLAAKTSKSFQYVPMIFLVMVVMVSFMNDNVRIM